MHSYTVKVKPLGVAPYRLSVIAQNSVEALLIVLKTMQAVGSISVRAAA